ncbi:MAG: hypothetical protein Q4P20_01980 [Eubacteriales bacterium]|nr:hypothetical protein [Eubacteriales bacterium]
MLSKLISYEFKATRRIFLPAYGVLLALSILNGIFIALPDSILDRITMPFGVILTIYIFAMFAVCVLTFAYMINRFYKNLLGDEGYLMFTLPARPSQLIWAKCIASTLWMFITAVLCCVSLILLVTPGLISHGHLILDADFTNFWQELSFAIRSIWHNYSFHTITLPILYIIIGIIWTANFCMHIYACLSIGSLATKHRLGFAFLAYLGFGIVWEIIVMLSASLSDLFPANWDLATFSNMTQMYVFCAVMIVYSIIKLVINFVITNYILSKRLNLQ